MSVECLFVIDSSTYSAFASSYNPISSSVSGYVNNTKNYIHMFFAYVLNKVYISEIYKNNLLLVLYNSIKVNQRYQNSLGNDPNLNLNIFLTNVLILTVRLILLLLCTVHLNDFNICIK